MPNTNYQRGVEAERRLKAHLEALGSFVMRSAGSRGAADLICLEPAISSQSSVRFIQVKCGDFENSYLVNVVRELSEYEERYSVIAELWHYIGDGRWRVFRPDIYLKNIGQPVYWNVSEYNDEGLMKIKGPPKRIRFNRPKISKAQALNKTVRAKAVPAGRKT